MTYLILHICPASLPIGERHVNGASLELTHDDGPRIKSIAMPADSPEGGIAIGGEYVEFMSSVDDDLNCLAYDFMSHFILQDMGDDEDAIKYVETCKRWEKADDGTWSEVAYG